MDYIAGTRMTQAEYEELADCSFVENFTKEQAQLYVAKNFGFDALRVEIIDSVATYKRAEKNSAKVILPDERHDRVPLYAASDWNYFRFDVCNFQYECVNGELYLYES